MHTPEQVRQSAAYLWFDFNDLPALAGFEVISLLHYCCDYVQKRIVVLRVAVAKMKADTILVVLNHCARYVLDSANPQDTHDSNHKLQHLWGLQCGCAVQTRNKIT